MPSTYAIPLIEKNLDLIQFLNQGVRPLIEEKSTYFLVMVTSPYEVTTAIMSEDDLYDEKGHTQMEVIWV